MPFFVSGSADPDLIMDDSSDEEGERGNNHFSIILAQHVVKEKCI